MDTTPQSSVPAATKSGSAAITYAAIALIIGAVVGGGAGYVLGQDMKSDDTAMSNDSSSDDAMMSSDTDGVLVGGAKMVRTLDIVDNAAKADNVTTVVAAVQAAGLVDTLKSAGPFTVFGPNNGAFEKLPAGTVDTLLKPENKATLTKILTYHVVPGTYTSADLKVMAQNGTTLTTVEGETLKPVVQDNGIAITDAKGGTAKVETADIISSNGVTHVIDAVLMPAQ